MAISIEQLAHRLTREPQQVGILRAGELDGVSSILNLWLNKVGISTVADPDHDTYGDRKFSLTINGTPIAKLAFEIHDDTVTQTIDPEYGAEHVENILIDNNVLAWTEEQDEGPIPYVAVRIPVGKFMLDLLWVKNTPHATWMFHKATEKDIRFAAELRKPRSPFHPISMQT